MENFFCFSSSEKQCISLSFYRDFPLKMFVFFAEVFFVLLRCSLRSVQSLASYYRASTSLGFREGE